MNELKHLLEPVLVRGKRYKNRITCAPSGAIGNVFPDGTINLHEVEELQSSPAADLRLSR